jgi:UDP-2,3-diacylglucosamine pyrophosphatase LpxH
VRKERHYQRRREINDQAYFLFMFSRLENRIREESAKLIQRKQGSISSWKQKAPWDVLPNQPNDGLKFKNRLALLTKKGASNFNIVSDYYKERNSIAHGGNFKRPISMPTVIIDLKKLYKALKA